MTLGVLNACKRLQILYQDIKDQTHEVRSSDDPSELLRCPFLIQYFRDKAFDTYRYPTRQIQPASPSCVDTSRKRSLQSYYSNICEPSLPGIIARKAHSKSLQIAHLQINHADGNRHQHEWEGHQSVPDKANRLTSPFGETGDHQIGAGSNQGAIAAQAGTQR